MSHRTFEILDAAIGVLGASGIRHLTHRAVDAQANLPVGSTSNVFRSREALLEGVLGRILDRDMAAWTRLVGDADPFDVDTFSTVAGKMLEELAATEREFALARFAVFVEAGLHEGLRQRIADNHARLSSWATPLLAALGARDPRTSLRLLTSYLDGLLLDQLVRPSSRFDPSAEIAAFLRATLHEEPPAEADAASERSASA